MVVVTGSGCTHFSALSVIFTGFRLSSQRLMGPSQRLPRHRVGWLARPGLCQRLHQNPAPFCNLLFSTPRRDVYTTQFQFLELDFAVDFFSFRYGFGQHGDPGCRRGAGGAGISGEYRRGTTHGVPHHIFESIRHDANTDCGPPVGCVRQSRPQTQILQRFSGRSPARRHPFSLRRSMYSATPMETAREVPARSGPASTFFHPGGLCHCLSLLFHAIRQETAIVSRSVPMGVGEPSHSRRHPREHTSGHHTQQTNESHRAGHVRCHSS